MNDRVHVEVKAGIAEVRLCRPEKRNALDQPMFEGLAMEFECSGALMGSPNQMEAIAASFEKREPQFRDPSA
jgi:enoyl-CoA hydratase/carnithine racemase